MAQVYIPHQMRELTGGVERIELAGETVRQLIAALDERFPGLAQRLRTGDGLTPGLSVSVDGALAARGLHARVSSASEVHFIPAIGGG